jgi:hypothetical protein
VTDRLGLGLQDQLGNYQPYRSGLIKLGWDDRTTGATVQSGGPNDGTWILPPAEYANPVGSNGLRLGLVNSATAQVTDVAIECTMGVDSQGPYGVYSQDPLSSPTPSYDSTDYTRYHDELLSTLQIFPTGHFGGTGSLEVCLYIDPAEGTSLTPSHLCDLDDTGLSHSFQIRYDHASCSVPLAIDSTDTLPINPDGSFGLDPLLPTGFSGGLEGGDEDPYFLFYATGSAWSDAANCSTSWTAQPQPTDLPDGLPCDPTNTPCTLDCSTTSCFQHCTGDGVDCQMSCPFGVCLQQCGSGATCDMSCAGGDCTTICDPGATCNAQCGADCTLVCGSVVCPEPPECSANQCDPGTGACTTTPVADLVACDVGDPVPGYCASGQCTTDYEGYVEALGDGRFRSVLLSGGGACCYDTPYEAGITYPNLYVDPALCDSYIENDSGGGLRLDYVGGGGACCYATVPELLAAWPNREICDGRPAF